MNRADLPYEEKKALYKSTEAFPETLSVSYGGTSKFQSVLDDGSLSVLQEMGITDLNNKDSQI